MVLVDKGDRAGEASAANAAWVWSLTRRPGIDIQLAEHSIAIHHQLRRELALDTEYQPMGGLLVATEEEELPHLEEHARAREACGSPVTVLGPRETREQEPLLTERVRGSLYSPESGCTNPIRLTLGLLEAAESRSARIFNRTEVLGIETRSGAVRAVVTDRGRIATDLVINAAGSWAGRVGQMVGLEVPVSPYRMGLLVTEPLPRTFSRVVMGASYMVAENEKADLADKSRFGSGLVASQQTSGNLLLGATWREAGFDKRSDFEEIRAMAAENLRFFPSLRPVRIIRSFANFFPFTADDPAHPGPGQEAGRVHHGRRPQRPRHLPGARLGQAHPGADHPGPGLAAPGPTEAGEVPALTTPSPVHESLARRPACFKMVTQIPE